MSEYSELKHASSAQLDVLEVHDRLTKIINTPQFRDNSTRHHLFRTIQQHIPEQLFIQITSTLGLEYSSFPGRSYDSLSREIIDHLNNRGKLDLLIQECVKRDLHSIFDTFRDTTPRDLSRIHFAPSATGREKTAALLIEFFKTREIVEIAENFDHRFSENYSLNKIQYCAVFITYIDLTDQSLKLIKQMKEDRPQISSIQALLPQFERRNHVNLVDPTELLESFGTKPVKGIFTLSFPEYRELSALINQRLSWIDLLELFFDAGIDGEQLLGDNVLIIDRYIEVLIELFYFALDDVLHDFQTSLQAVAPDVKWREKIVAVKTNAHKGLPELKDIPARYLALADAINRQFSLNHLGMMLFDLNLNRSAIDIGKGQFISKLVHEMNEGVKEPHLMMLTWFAKERPHINWEKISGQKIDVQGGNRRIMPYNRNLKGKFNPKALRQLFQVVWPSNGTLFQFCEDKFPYVLSGLSIVVPIRENLLSFIDLIARRGRLEELLSYLEINEPVEFQKFKPILYGQTG